MEQCETRAERERRLQVLLEVFGVRTPYTPAFLRKSAQVNEGKRVVKHSLGKERKERRKRVPKREKPATHEGERGFGRVGDDNSQRMVAWKC
jgi:hypothetical protein